MNRKTFFACLFLFLFAFLIRVHYIFEKRGFHVDEMLSLSIIQGKYIECMSFLSHNYKYLSGEDIKSFYFGGFQNSLSEDLKNLRADNYNDFSHPSLYYSLLRIVTHFTGISQDSFKFAGCGLNLVFFTFSFFIMQKLLIRLFGDNKLVPIGLIFAFLNTGTISMTLFIRPYELQIFAVILISYVYILIKDILIGKDKNLSFKLLFAAVFSVSLTMLSGYYLLLYIFILGINLLWLSRNNIKNLIKLIDCFFVSVICTLIVYKGYFLVLGGQRFDFVSSNIDTFDIYNYMINFVYYFLNLYNFLFYGSVILILIISVRFLNRNKVVVGQDILISIFIWSVVIGIISPFPVVRYISPALALFSAAIVGLVSNIKNEQQNIFICLLAFLFILSSVFPVKRESNDSLIYYGDQGFHIPFAGSLENLYLSEHLNLDNNIPVLVESCFWYSPLYIISDLKDSQVYHLRTKNTNKYYLRNITSNHFYLFLDILFSKFDYDKDKYNITIKKIGKFKRYVCYEVLVKS